MRFSSNSYCIYFSRKCQPSLPFIQTFVAFSIKTAGFRMVLPLLFPITVILLPHGKIRTDSFKPKNAGPGDHQRLSNSGSSPSAPVPKTDRRFCGVPCRMDFQALGTTAQPSRNRTTPPLSRTNHPAEGIRPQNHSGKGGILEPTDGRHSNRN